MVNSVVFTHGFINKTRSVEVEKDELTHKVIGCAIEVHKQLGPGLLESTYEHCLLYELRCKNIQVASQVVLPVYYKDVSIDAGYRLDLVVAEKLIVELKAVEKLRPIHQAQLLTYMKLSNLSKGLLINFNVTRLTNGIKRLVL